MLAFYFGVLLQKITDLHFDRRVTLLVEVLEMNLPIESPSMMTLKEFMPLASTIDRVSRTSSSMLRRPAFSLKTTASLRMKFDR